MLQRGIKLRNWPRNGNLSETIQCGADDLQLKEGVYVCVNYGEGWTEAFSLRWSVLEKNWWR